MSPARSGAAAATIALVALVLAACSGGGEQAEPATTTTAAPTTTTTVPEADLRVLDPGAEPRRELRYRLTEGTSTLATFTTDLELEQERLGVRQRLDAPPVRQTLAHRVAAVADDGTATVESEVVALEVQAEGTGLTVAEVDELQRQLDPLAGNTSALELGPRGEVRGFEASPGDSDDSGNSGNSGNSGDSDHASAGAGAGDDLAAVLGLAPVLPTEPLGVGGRWEAATEVELAGRTATVQRTYALTAVDDQGFSWELDLSIDGAGTFEGQASGTNRWDAPVGELTARVEGERLLDPETLELVAAPSPGAPRSTTSSSAPETAGPTDPTEPAADPEPGAVADADADAIVQEIVLAYRATVAPPIEPAAPAATGDPSTTPAGEADGT